MLVGVLGIWPITAEIGKEEERWKGGESRVWRKV